MKSNWVSYACIRRTCRMTLKADISLTAISLFAFITPEKSRGEGVCPTSYLIKQCYLDILNN